MRKTTIHTGHPAIIQPVTRAELPTNLQYPEVVDNYTKFWTVTVIGRTWVVARGHEQAPGQHVVWYPNGQFWSSFGTTIIGAIDAAAKDAWLYL